MEFTIAPRSEALRLVLAMGLFCLLCLPGLHRSPLQELLESLKMFSRLGLSFSSLNEDLQVKRHSFDILRCFLPKRSCQTRADIHDRSQQRMFRAVWMFLSRISRTGRLEGTQGGEVFWCLDTDATTPKKNVNKWPRLATDTDWRRCCNGIFLFVFNGE